MSPIKLAIVGGGPSSFYVASRLLSLLPKSSSQVQLSRVDIFDRLWAPHGLVRYGVAPDHPEVKNCTNKFDAAATDPRLRFFGNVNIGTPFSAIPHSISLPLSEVFRHYTHLLFSTGCTVPILHEALPPSDHCVPALSLVHWYTQHPSRPRPPPLEKLTHVTLIGQGNVSLDIARMLLTPPSVLEKFDVPAPVLDVLSRSAVKHVSIVGRRGPYEAAFTTKELREMMNLPDASMTPVDPTLLQAPEGTTSTRQQERMIQLLRKGSKNPPGSTPKTWSFEFFRSPTGLARPSASTPATLTLAHTMLDPATRRAVSTSHTSTLDTSLVVTSLGHRAEPTQPWYDPALGHIRTLSGRVIDASGNALRGVYASGWAAMGARGVLASTLMDAYAVADTIISDSLPGKDILATTAVSSATALQRDPAYGAGGGTSLLAADPDPDSVPPAVEEGLRAGVVTTYEDWKLVDEQEVRSGNATDKERERMGWDEARAFLTRVKTAN